MIDESSNVDSGTKVPRELYDYINKHFSGASLSDIITETDMEDHVFFKVDVSLEDTLFHLKFNSNGILVQRASEPLLELFDDEYTITD